MAEQIADYERGDIMSWAIPAGTDVTHLCAHRLHEWCADVPPAMSGCECPCHTQSDGSND